MKDFAPILFSVKLAFRNELRIWPKIASNVLVDPCKFSDYFKNFKLVNRLTPGLLLSIIGMKIVIFPSNFFIMVSIVGMISLVTHVIMLKFFFL